MDEVKRQSDEIEIFQTYTIDKKVLSEVDIPWDVKSSPLGGRGIFSKRKILTGELLFADPPLVLGPRSNNTSVCVGCHSEARLKSCSNGCGLPLCSKQCETSHLHVTECGFLNKIYEKKDEAWNPHLYVCLTAIRCLFLNENDKKILLSLEGHSSPQHELILHAVNKSLNGKLSSDDVKIIKRGLEVLDAVAFETVNPETSTSLKGIYPLSALMNHSCIPNTRHCFGSDNKMFVESVVDIPPGQEITTTYTCLTWGNQARKHHLMRTKHFCCNCERCKDPKEFGTQLMALYCLRNSCSGVILPKSDEAGMWLCESCGAKVSQIKIRMIQKAIGSFVSSMDIKNPRLTCKVLRNKCMVPNSNQIAVDVKFHMARYYKNHSWKDLANDELLLKELMCRELLILLKILKLGECRLRGFLLLELYQIMLEKASRSRLDPVGLPQFKHLEESSMLEQAKSILKNDFSAQKMLKHCEDSKTLKSGPPFLV